MIGQKVSQGHSGLTEPAFYHSFPIMDAAPKVDFSKYTMDDGTVVSTKERIDTGKNQSKVRVNMAL